MPQNKEIVRDSELYEAILHIKDLDTCQRFFHDLCSMNELNAIEQRFKVAKLLYEGAVYTEILRQTGASSATISRVNRALNYSADGLKEIFETIYPKE